MYSVNYNTKVLYYFQKLQTRIKIARDRALYRVSGYVKTATKRSMRTRVGASEPGRPPHAHTRTGLRMIEFRVDTLAGASIIGPVKFAGSNFFNEPVTYVQEFGGTFISRRGFSQYPKRSYMKYTLDKLVSSGKLPRQFSASMGRVLN